MEETPKTEEQTAPVASTDMQSEGADATTNKDAAEQVLAETTAEVTEAHSIPSKERLDGMLCRRVMERW